MMGQDNSKQEKVNLLTKTVIILPQDVESY